MKRTLVFIFCPRLSWDWDNAACVGPLGPPVCAECCCRVKLERMSGPVLMFLLTSSLTASHYVPAKWSGTVATPIGAGEPGDLGWARPGLQKPHIKAGGASPPEWSSLCRGLAPGWRCALLCPNSGTGQSDSAQKPERSDIFEELQVITFKYKQQP